MQVIEEKDEATKVAIASAGAAGATAIVISPKAHPLCSRQGDHLGGLFFRPQHDNNLSGALPEHAETAYKVQA